MNYRDKGSYYVSYFTFTLFNTSSDPSRSFSPAPAVTDIRLKKIAVHTNSIETFRAINPLYPLSQNNVVVLSSIGKDSYAPQVYFHTV